MSDQTSAASFDLPGFGGPILRPGDEGYDEARKVFNGMIDRRPALIARCSGADDPQNLFRHNQNIPPTAG